MPLMMPYHAARGGGGVAGARRVSVVAARPAGAPALRLSRRPLQPGTGVCVLGWVGLGAPVVSLWLGPVGPAALLPGVAGVWRAWLAAAASGSVLPPVLGGDRWYSFVLVQCLPAHCGLGTSKVYAGADPGFIVRSFCHGLLRPYCNERASQIEGIEGESEERSRFVWCARTTDSNG